MSQKGTIGTGGIIPSGGVAFLRGDAGGNVGADGGGAITLNGGTGLFITGSPGTNSLTFAISGATAQIFDADTGSAVPVVNTINFLGDAAQGSITNAAGSTVTLTISDASEAQKGTIETSTDAETIDGTLNNKAVVPTSLSAKLGVQTLNAMPIGSGPNGAFTWSAAGLDGEILIGQNGGVPQ